MKYQDKNIKFWTTCYNLVTPSLTSLYIFCVLVLYLYSNHLVFNILYLIPIFNPIIGDWDIFAKS